MFTSFWKTRTNSRNCLPSCETVAAARMAGSSVHVAPFGSTMSVPTAPLLPCLIGSAGIRFVAPNSIGVATRLPSGMTSIAPAYQR